MSAGLRASPPAPEMPGGRNGSQKWGGHQPNGRSRREDLWGDGGAYGFRGTPRERAAAAIERAEEGAEEGAAAAAPVTLFVRTGAGRTRTVRVALRASVAELEDAVRRKVPGAEAMRLCAVGGPPLVAARGLIVL